MNVDISGRPIPEHATAAARRVLAASPVRNVANDRATELNLWMYRSVPASTLTPLTMLAGAVLGPFTFTMPESARGRLDYMLVEAPDPVAATSPYLGFRLRMNVNSNVPGWPETFVVHPSATAAAIQLPFPIVVDLDPGVTLTAGAINVDAVNTHFLNVYLHGWMWPKDLVEG